MAIGVISYAKAATLWILRPPTRARWIKQTVIMISAAGSSAAAIQHATGKRFSSTNRATICFSAGIRFQMPMLTNRIDVALLRGRLSKHQCSPNSQHSNETSNTVDFILPDITYCLPAVRSTANAIVNRVSYSARDLGVDVTKASTRLDWSYHSEAGFVWNLENKAQFDAYMFDEHGPKPACRILKLRHWPPTAVSPFYPLVRRATLRKH